MSFLPGLSHLLSKVDDAVHNVAKSDIGKVAIIGGIALATGGVSLGADTAALDAAAVADAGAVAGDAYLPGAIAQAAPTLETVVESTTGVNVAGDAFLPGALATPAPILDTTVTSGSTFLPSAMGGNAADIANAAKGSTLLDSIKTGAQIASAAGSIIGSVAQGASVIARAKGTGITTPKSATASGATAATDTSQATPMQQAATIQKTVDWGMVFSVAGIAVAIAIAAAQKKG